eukprot:1323130-Rhodomonas_salina.2
MSSSEAHGSAWSRVLNQWKETKGTVGGDVEWRDPEGFAALHFAALSGDPDMVNALLQKKADPNARNDDGNTPLHLAALTAQLNACRVLAEIGHAKVTLRARCWLLRVRAKHREGGLTGGGRAGQ